VQRSGPLTVFSFRRIGRDALIYGVSLVLGRSASVLMLPVYTRYLTPADYGTLHLLQITIDLAAVLLSAGVISGVFRFYFKAQDAHASLGVIVSAFCLLLATNGLGFGVLYLAAPTLGTHVFGDPGTAILVRISALTFALDALTIVPMTLMQAQKRALLHGVTSICRLVLQLSLNILFVVGLGWNVLGILVSTLIASVVVGSIATVWMLKQTGIRFDIGAGRDLYRFGMPYKFVAAGTMILTFGDRIVLKAYHDLGQVGVYSLAYQFGFVLAQLTAPIMSAWNPFRFQLETHPRKERDRLYNQGFLIYNFILIGGAVTISLFVGPLLAVMADPAFLPAAPLVPVIVFAIVLMCWDNVFQLGAQIAEHTKCVTYSTWVAVVVMVACYFVLIPPFGMMGAAAATFIGFAVQAVVQFFWSQSVWPITYRWASHLRMLGFGAAVVVVRFLIGDQESFAANVALGISLIGAYLLLVWFGGVLDRETRSAIRGQISRLRPSTDYAAPFWPSIRTASAPAGFKPVSMGLDPAVPTEVEQDTPTQSG
jgi:O-antigen/teichoic acid export membrane protein